MVASRPPSLATADGAGFFLPTHHLFAPSMLQKTEISYGGQKAKFKKEEGGEQQSREQSEGLTVPVWMWTAPPPCPR